MTNDEVCHVAETSFRSSLASTDFPVEPKRYWLFTSKLCPFAHRTEIARKVLKLEEFIGLTITGSVQTELGWNIGDRYLSDDSQPGPIENIDRLPAYYELASPGYNERCSVPVLFDLVSQRIVNNESSEIIQQFNSLSSQHVNNQGAPELFPAQSKYDIERAVQFLNNDFITPIYLAGFAKSQSDYNDNADRVFNALAKLEQRLSDKRQFMLGDVLTLADIHAFPHLARFDGAYHSLYRLNRNFIRDFPFTAAYTQRLSQVPGFGDTLDISAMKEGYFLSWNQPTFGGFVPDGPMVNDQSGIALG